MLRSVDRWLATYVSGQPIGLICQGQAVGEELVGSACTAFAVKGTVIRSMLKGQP
jgi:hypothetical protein